jgi:hypothetical protein
MIDPRRTSTIAVAAATFLAACGGGGEAATATEPQAGALVVAEMVLEDAAGNVVYSHRDHWHGFLVAPAGGTLGVRKHFVARSGAADDHEMPPRTDWFTLAPHADVLVRTTVAEPAVADWRGDRVSAQVVGRRAGATTAAFEVKRGATTMRELPSLPLVVR